MTVTPPAACLPHLSLGITGHRASNAALVANCHAVKAALAALFDQIDTLLSQSGPALAPVRLHNLLVDGVDQITAQMALDRGWELVAPLPFGQHLNTAINAQPGAVKDARLLLARKPAGDPDVEARAASIREISARAHLFELADRDDDIAALFLAAMEDPADYAKMQAFHTESADQVALAGTVMIERCDLLLAVWDGRVANLPGGTGHTIVQALEKGTPVLVIDPACPDEWTVRTRPEELALQGAHDPVRLEQVISACVTGDDVAPAAMAAEQWRAHSSGVWSFYRRIEAVFGSDEHRLRSLATAYETPAAIADGSGAGLLANARQLPHGDSAMLERIGGTILPQFAWSDGISSWLSDAYRSGMCFNFLLSALAVVIGVAYLPWDLAEQKWIFASIELLLLVLIVAITAIGGKRRWHARWFETRRVAEYLRHGPIMLLLGVSRPTGRWPRGKGSDWPERFARNCLRALGLPRMKLDRAYLKSAVETVLAPHVSGQLAYHRAKAERLHNVHHRLDRLAERLFVLAIISVSAYLLLKLGAVLDLLPATWPDATSKLFTFLGVTFPTLGASIAGIRFFGDFERFAAISQVTAEKLGDVEVRIALLLAGPEEAITYGRVADLAHAIDEIVVDEIENWQAVFGGKHLALPA